ncbi:MAG: O-antigen ligase family protein [Calditrichia bacterium]
MEIKNNILHSNMRAQWIENLGRKIFFVYLTVYLTVQYMTKFSPYTLYTLVMIPGLLVAMMIAIKNRHQNKYSVPLDVLIFFLAVLLFTISALMINGTESSMIDIRRYFVSFSAYFFVRYTVGSLNKKIILSIFSIYLIASGILSLLQIYGGERFYLSFYLADKVNCGAGYCGFANFSNISGVLILWPLSVIIAMISTAELKSGSIRMVHWFAIVLGTIGLYFTFSRAGWLGLFVALMITLATVIVLKKPFYTILRAAAVVIVIFVCASFIPTPADSHREVKLRVIDYSSYTRIVTARVALHDVIRKRPIWGVGVGKFPDYYQRFHTNLSEMAKKQVDPRERINVHNSYLEYIVEVGTLPSVVMFIFIACIIINAARGSISNPAFPFIIGLIAVSVWMFFHDFFKDRLFWIALAMVAVFSERYRKMSL